VVIHAPTISSLGANITAGNHRQGPLGKSTARLLKEQVSLSYTLNIKPNNLLGGRKLCTRSIDPRKLFLKNDKSSNLDRQQCNVRDKRSTKCP
jgi:hypothetical protein